MTVSRLPDLEATTSPLTDHDIRALRYVRNTNGGATRDHFFEDHDPIGGTLWRRLAARGLVTENEKGRVILTPLGVEKFQEHNQP